MALPTTYTQAHGVLADFFSKIRDGQAPEKFSIQQLKDIGYKSNNHRPFIPLMKSLGFLSPDGVPTSRYHEYRDHSKSKEIMGEALKEAYSDIFLIKSNPLPTDKNLIEGKFKSFHNTSDNVAGLMAKTFYALLDIADINFNKREVKINPEETKPEEKEGKETKKNIATLGLNYNIEIHLPATKDVEVYNAIFKSLNDHLLE